MSTILSRYRKIVWTVRYVMQVLGGMRVTAVFLLLCSAVLCAVVLLPLQHDVDNARQRLARAQALPMVSNYKSSMTGKTRVFAPQLSTQLGQFYESFPNTDQFTKILGQIYDAAPKHKLTLLQGQYRLVNPSVQSLKSPLQHFEIVFPVNGVYKDIRNFAGEILMNHKTMALDAVTFSRGNSLSNSIDAELHFTLYLQGAP